MLPKHKQAMSEKNLADVNRREILKFLNARSVACLASTSKDWLVVAREERLWKEINKQDKAGYLIASLVQRSQRNILDFLDARSRQCLSITSKKLNNIAKDRHVQRYNAVNSARLSMHPMSWFIERQTFGLEDPQLKTQDLIQELQDLHASYTLWSNTAISSLAPPAVGMYLYFYEGSLDRFTSAAPEFMASLGILSGTLIGLKLAAQYIVQQQILKKILYTRVSLHDVFYATFISDTLSEYPYNQQYGAQTLELAEEVKSQRTKKASTESKQGLPSLVSIKRQFNRVVNKKCSLVDVGFFLVRTLKKTATEVVVTKINESAKFLSHLGC